MPRCSCCGQEYLTPEMRKLMAPHPLALPIGLGVAIIVLTISWILGVV